MISYFIFILPGHQIIKNIVQAFEKTGSVVPGRSKRQIPTQKRQEAKKQLETMVKEFSNLSIRKAASAVNVSITIVYSILHDDLHLKPHKFNVWQKLETHDYQKRVDFSQWFLSLAPDAKFRLICSDEAYFYLTLPVNKQNQRIWSELQPNKAWRSHCTTRKFWFGAQFPPLRFTECTSSTVNQHNYLDMIQSFFY